MKRFFSMTLIPAVVLHWQADPVRYYQISNFSKSPTVTATKNNPDISSANNLTEALYNLGINIRQIDGSASHAQFTIGPFGDNAGQNTLVLIDGIPQIYPDLGTPNLNFLPIKLVDQINLIPGSQGVALGDQAVAGAINIQTIIPKQPETVVQTTYGSFASSSFYAHIVRQINADWSYLLAANTQQSHNYREHNDDTNQHLSLYLQDQYQNIHYDFNHELLQYPGALTRSQVISDPTQASRPGLRDYNMENNNLISDHWNLFDNGSEQFKLLSQLELMDGHGILTYQNQSSRYALNLLPIWTNNFSSHYFSSNEIGANANLGQYHFDADQYDSLAKANNFSLYDQLHGKLFQPLQYTIGARSAVQFSSNQLGMSGSSQEVNAVQHATIGSAELDWLVTQNTTLFLRDAGSYRFPKTDENINTVTGKPLKAQTGWSLETGPVWHTKQFAGLFELYRINLNNEITAIPIPNSTTTFAQNQNLPPTYRIGMRANMQWHLSKAFLWETNSELTKARFSSGPDAGKRIPFVPNITLVNTLYWQITPHWLSHITNHFIGQRSYANDPEQRSPLLGGYNLLDVGLEFKYHTLTIDGEIDNLSNKKYYEYAFDIYNGDQTSNYYFPAAGRTFMLNLTWRSEGNKT